MRAKPSSPCCHGSGPARTSRWSLHHPSWSDRPAPRSPVSPQPRGERHTPRRPRIPSVWTGLDQGFPFTDGVPVAEHPGQICQNFQELPKMSKSKRLLTGEPRCSHCLCPNGTTMCIFTTCFTLNQSMQNPSYPFLSIPILHSQSTIIFFLNRTSGFPIAMCHSQKANGKLTHHPGGGIGGLEFLHGAIEVLQKVGNSSLQGTRNGREPQHVAAASITYHGQSIPVRIRSFSHPFVSSFIHR